MTASRRRQKVAWKLLAVELEYGFTKPKKAA
jgi:hypothetical protein